MVDLPSIATLERHSISLIGFSVFFGVLIGVSILLSAFYATGVFSDDDPVAEAVPTGMEILEDYTCQRAETKQIILGGVEDNFDPAGVERSNPSEDLVKYLVSLKEGRTPSDILKTYDDPRQDTAFSDQFDIPKRTFNGLFVVRINELSGLKNDGISLGYKTSKIPAYIDYGYGFRADVSSLSTATDWENHDTLFFTSLKDLKILRPIDENITLLEVIRTQGVSDGPLFVEIADDTVVDFMGFALCLEPEDDLGMVFGPTHPSDPDVIVDVGPEIAWLTTSRAEGQFCSYSGCLSCESERPVACIRDMNLPLPDGHKPDYSMHWTGGEFEFTTPVKGSKFATEDDVDAFCSTEFGLEWRALSRHDGWSGGGMSGLGEFPSNYENVWVNVKDSDHHNCWKTRPDYEVRDDG